METFMNDYTANLMTNYITFVKRKNNFSSSTSLYDSETEKPKSHESSRLVEYKNASKGRGFSEYTDEAAAHSRTKTNYSPLALSAVGLKLVSCGIPRKAFRKSNNLVEKSAEEFSSNSSSSVSHAEKRNSKKVFRQTPSSPADRLKKKSRYFSNENVCKKVLIESNPPSVPNKMLCVTVQGKKDGTSHEIIIDLNDFNQTIRMFPKLLKVMPEVDAGEKELKFSATAVKTVLGFLLSPSYNIQEVRNEGTAVEILALIRSWEIQKFQNSFKDHFLNNILTSKNAHKIYSFADYYSLQDIKEACVLLHSCPDIRKYREKICNVSVSTYEDPLEYFIPLKPVLENFAECFDRDIINDLIFESLSKTYILTGLELKLKICDVKERKKLNINYSCESVEENLIIPQKTISKPLGSTIIINFKKNMTVLAGQKVKITIEMQTKPSLCFTLDNDCNLSNDNFRLTLTSNRKVSEKSLVIINKLYYFLKSPQTDLI